MPKINRNKLFPLFGSLFLIVMLMFGLFYSQFYLKFGPRQANYLWVEHTSLSEEKIGVYSIGQDLNSIKPKPEIKNDHDFYDYYSLKIGPSIATNKNDDKIIRIWYADRKQKLYTAKGISLGDSKKEVILAYGDSFYKRQEQGLSIIGYVDKKLNHTLEFWFSDEKVETIRLDISCMN